jgi:RND family efflux transporter MFP subunit
MTPVLSRRRIAVPIGLAVLAALAVWGWRRGSAPRPPVATPAATGGGHVCDVVVVQREDFRDNLSLGGTLAGIADNVLRFGTEGVVQEVYFKDGERVRRGELIARLDQEEAGLRLTQATLDLSTKQDLYARGDLSKTKLREAEVAEGLARVALKKTEIRAARNGVLGGLNTTPGDQVDPSKVIGHLADISTMTLRIGIPEKQLERIALGQRVEFTVGSLPNATFTGQIDRISPYIDPDSNMGTAYADIPNDAFLLLPNMFARVRVAVFEAPDVVAVPRESMVTPDGDRLFVVNSDGRAEERAVSVSYRSAQFAVVVKGLEPGDRVICPVPAGLRPGDAVKVLASPK